MNKEKSGIQTITRRNLLKASGVVPLLGVLGSTRIPACEGDPPLDLALFSGDACDVRGDLEELLEDPEMQAFNAEIRPLLQSLREGLESTVIPPAPPPQRCSEQSGDVNADGSVDIADPVTLLNYLFGTGPEPAPICPPMGEVEVPVVELTAQDRDFFRAEVEELLPVLLEPILGDEPPLQPEVIGELIEKAIDRVGLVLGNPKFDPSLIVANHAQDFDVAVIGEFLVATDKVARGMILMTPAILLGAQQGPPNALLLRSLDTGQILILVSLNVEIVGLILGLLGIALPKINMAKVLKALKPYLREPSVRRAIRNLIRILADTGKSLAEKAAAIIEFLRRLAGAGAIAAMFGAIFTDFDFLDLAELILSIVLFLFSFSNPATGAVTAIKVGKAVANSLLPLIGKIRNLAG